MKRYILLLIISIVFLSIEARAEEIDNNVTMDILPGDLNGDKSVNMKDLSLIQQFLNNWDVAIDYQAADVNADNKINMKDYSLFQRYLNGWDVELEQFPLNCLSIRSTSRVRKSGINL